MDDGIIQLIFFALIIVASLVDAAARSRKKKERMEEMDREEAQSGRGEGRTLPEGPRTATGAPRTRPEVGREGTPDDESADSMIPDEFWAVLTGEERPRPVPREAPPQEAPRTGPREARRSPRERAGHGAGPPERETRGSPMEAYRRPGGAERTQAEDAEALRRMEAAAAEAEEVGGATGTRRSDRWMTGLEGRDAGSDRWATGSEREGREVEGVVELSLEEPWDRLDAIASEEISDRGGEALGDEVGDEGGPPRLSLRKRPASRYTGLLTGGSVEELRKAVVLKEVLGGPVGWREESDLPGWK